MKILFVVLNAGLAGHTRTSAIIGRALQARGHKVMVLISKNSNSSVFDSLGLPCVRTNHAQNWLGHYPCLCNDISRITLQHSIDLVHCFDGLAIAQVLWACKSLRLRCFFTLCGGPPQKRMLSVKPTISLSEEGRDRLLQITKLQKEDIKVIPARIELSNNTTDSDESTLHFFRNKYALPSDVRIVLRIARIGPAYISSILQAIDSVERLYCEGRPVRFVHIGYVQDPDLYRILVQKIDLVNARCRAKIAISAQDEAQYANKYINLADVVIGVGRSAFEAMSQKKPVIVVGKDSFAGTVCPETVNTLAYYNFSGRNASSMTYDASVLQLTTALRQLLKNDDYYKSIATFGRHYVEKNLDVRKAVEEYEQVYSAYSGIDYPRITELLQHTVFPVETWKTSLVTSRAFGPLIKRLRQWIYLWK